MNKEWRKKLINRHFKRAKDLTNKLRILLKNETKNYLKPTKLQFLKALFGALIFSITNLIGLFYYPNFFLSLPKFYLGLFFVGVISMLTPIFLIKLFASVSNLLNEDQLIRFVRKNSFYEENATNKIFAERFNKEFNKELNIGEFKRLELFLFQGKGFNSRDYIIRDRFKLIRSFFFAPIIYLRKKGQQNITLKKIMYYLLLVVGMVYTKLYSSFGKTILYRVL